MRSSVAGALTGVLLLAAMIGFAVGLPEWTGDAEAAGEGSSELPELPDELGDLRASDAIEDLPEADRIHEYEESAASALEELYDESAVVRLYFDEGLTTQATVTVMTGEPGLFQPDGPPIDPALIGVERGQNDLRSEGDAVCAVAYQQVVPEGQPVPEDELPAQVQCQQGDDGLTYELVVGGTSVEDTAALLDDLVAATG